MGENTTLSRKPTGGELGRELGCVVTDLPLSSPPRCTAAGTFGGVRRLRRSPQRSLAMTGCRTHSSGAPGQSRLMPRPTGCGRGLFRSAVCVRASTATTCWTTWATRAPVRSSPSFKTFRLANGCRWRPTAPSEVTALRIAGFELNHWLLWRKPDSTWAWALTDLADGSTRLVTRVHALYEWRKPLSALLGVLLMEFGDFAMMRRMLRGIKARAETLHAESR
jgi:hypothetical protein